MTLPSRAGIMRAFVPHSDALVHGRLVTHSFTQ